MKGGWLLGFYPTTIVADRYTGAYSGGEWLAFPLDAWDVPEEIECDDVTCMIFWDTYDGIVEKGSTPERAMADLVAKMDKALETE